jgi:hypothetical protein
VTFLPIVERELRVAARKRNTFWLRIVAALVALVIGGGFLVLTLSLPFGLTQLGGVLFALLTWMSLATALSAGLFFTSDCVSEEKREGTLGFLFLTDLRGYDVVLGKLLATSLRCFFALLAIFPILAVTMLMGGVTGPQFWKTVLALVNALFCSLAVGMFVSSVSRDSQRALGGTLFVLLLLIFVGPALDGSAAAMSGRTFRPFFSLCSPGFVFLWANRWGETYWPGLLANQIFIWLLLGLACALVPRTWQQRGASNTVSRGSWSYSWRYGGAERRSSLRQKLLGKSPVLWLACRVRWQSVLVWMLVVITLVGFTLLALADWQARVWITTWSFIGGALTLIFYLGTASQACRFLVEARRSGLIELLLSSPLDGKEIVHGQWQASVRMFALPMILFLCVQMAEKMLSTQATWGLMATAGGSGLAAIAMPILAGFMTAVVTGANLVTLCWFGMWMGMTSKNANFATLKTILFVQVIPWIVIYFASSILTYMVFIPTLMKATTSANANAAITSGFAWFPLVFSAVAGVLFIGKDVFFSLLARRRLYSSFREMAVRAVAPVHTAALGTAPRPLTAPPSVPIAPQ